VTCCSASSVETPLEAGSGSLISLLGGRICERLRGLLRHDKHWEERLWGRRRSSYKSLLLMIGVVIALSCLEEKIILAWRLRSFTAGREQVIYSGLLKTLLLLWGRGTILWSGAVGGPSYFHVLMCGVEGVNKQGMSILISSVDENETMILFTTLLTCCARKQLRLIMLPSWCWVVF
jgi:hypothetical protein